MGKGEGMTDETHKKLTEAVACLLLHITMTEHETSAGEGWLQAARADVFALLARARHERDYPEDRG